MARTRNWVVESARGGFVGHYQIDAVESCDSACRLGQGKMMILKYPMSIMLWMYKSHKYDLDTR